MVETILNYLAPMAERPYYYNYPPPDGIPWRNTKGDRRRVVVGNAREIEPAPDLDREGFALARFETKQADLRGDDAVRSGYYPEVEALVAEATGARRVLAFDHNLRSGERQGRDEDGIQGPVRYAHNDYTLESGPQRVRDLLPADEAEACLRRRFSVINVWKPVGGPVLEAPLAFCDAGSLRQEHFVATDLLYPDRQGEVYSLSFDPGHRWYYYPEMGTDEALLLKCYDSDPDHARFTAHSAFDDPTSPADATPRESIEVRTLAFF